MAEKKKEKTKTKSTKKYEFYKVEGNVLKSEKRVCPKCGSGVFMADHKDRYHCGKCSYTEFKKTESKETK